MFILIIEIYIRIKIIDIIRIIVILLDWPIDRSIYSITPVPLIAIGIHSVGHLQENIFVVHIGSRPLLVLIEAQCMKIMCMKIM